MQVTIKGTLKTYWKDYAMGLTVLLLTNLLGAAIPLQVKHLLDVIPRNDGAAIIQGLWAIGLMAFAMFIVRVASRFFLIGVGRKIDYAVRMQLFSHLLTLPRSYYDVHQTGELMSRLTNDLTALRMFLGGGVMLLANVVFAYATVLPMMAMLSWPLTLLAFLLYPAVMGLMRFLSRRVKHASNTVQDRLGDITALAQENLSGMATIQAYAKEPVESRRFYDHCMRYFQAYSVLVKYRVFLYILIGAVSGLSHWAVLAEGGREVMVGMLSLSGLVAFMLYLERLSWPTVSMGWILSSFQQGLNAKERINEVFAAQPEINDAQADVNITALPEGPLRLVNLSFSYRDTIYPSATGSEKPEETNEAIRANTRDWALQNVSLTIQPGTLVALVGPIGAGKTTLLHLLVRLYKANDRSIFIGDVPLENIPLAVLRHHVTLMPQNSFLFSTTLHHNVAYVDPDTHRDNVKNWAQVAHIDEEIMQLPDDYETVVGERGVTLSGGQRQRTALARTLLVEPSILLLDDPFSNVDAEIEAMIIQAFKQRRLLHNKTTIFASQRFAMVRQADCIVVLDETGRLAGVGTHAELVANCPLYVQLSQQSSNKDTEQPVIQPGGQAR